MWLIITKQKLPQIVRYDVASNITDGKLSIHDYDGLSTEEIRFFLKTEDKNSIIISADSRFLLFQNEFFQLDDILLYENNYLSFIADCTEKELRPAHSLFRMYEAGVFQVKLKENAK